MILEGEYVMVSNFHRGVIESKEPDPRVSHAKRSRAIRLRHAARSVSADGTTRAEHAARSVSADSVQRADTRRGSG